MLSRTHTSRIRSTLLALAAACALCLSVALAAAPAAPGAVFRAFSPTSPWNLPAAPDSISSSNPFAGQFTSYSDELSISGLPSDADYASPVFFAQPGDPTTTNVDLTTDWSPKHSLRWDRGPVPIPSGAYPAPGSDGHMTIVSADGTRDWEFWRATKVSPSGITAAVIVQWDLTGPGYAANRPENSARGSGTPLISTSLRAEEALNGIPHALGITVPSVSSDYVYPVASHTDGNDGSNAIKYGMLFVLRPDYPVPPNAGIGERNIIQALKTYGAYVIDQGASFELDADSTHPGLWSQTGLKPTTLDIRGSDMRLARTGVGPPTPPAAQARRPHRRKVVLHVKHHRVHPGGRIKLSGKVRSRKEHLRVRIEVKVGHHWRGLRRKPVEANGTFATWPHLKRRAHASYWGARTSLHLKHVRLRHGVRVLKLRAVVRHVGHSNVVHVRIRR
jgi:hypothetical protein